MDVIVHSAIDEICSQGTRGIDLPKIWSKIRPTLATNGLELCPFVKAAVWTDLLEVPGLQFEAQGVSYSLERDSSTLNSVEKCESMNLTIVAPEKLRNNFVGIYDVEASVSSINDVQRRILERLAVVGTNGTTQSELAKEFGIKSNNFFYYLKKLESRGMIARHLTVIRTKEAGSDNYSVVTTNTLYLHRFAKHLGCQKRLEITKEGIGIADESIGSGIGFTEESKKEDILVKDYLPAYKAICVKLEEADGKVLVVSDIKRDLNYVGKQGHRAWRNIFNKLKEAKVVESFCAKIKNKEVSCLRLLKKFSPAHFEAKKSSGLGNNSPDGDQFINLPKRGQITEQLVELPIEQQIYDLIDSSGSNGVTINDVRKKLGLKNKQYYDRLLQFFSRFGMPIRSENHNRGVVYRVWTSNNFNSVNTDMVGHKSESLLDKNAQEFAEINEGADDAIVVYDVGVEPEGFNGSTTRRECNNTPVSADKSLSCDYEPSSSRPGGLGVDTVSADVTSLEISPSVATTTSKRRRRQSYIRYPCLNIEVPNAQREQRILKMLEEEKFLVKAEIHRRLEDLETEKDTKMGSRTLERCLNKLQKEGLCKCIVFQVPVMTNLANNRRIEVVLHPHTNEEAPEILCQKIMERIRSFDTLIRRHCYSQLKKGQDVPVLDDIQRIPSSLETSNQAAQVEARRANGYVRARMVQSKLLHIYLWKYLNEGISFQDIESDLENPHSTWRLFELNAAVKAMPIELYLQIIGSTEKSDNLNENRRKGHRLSDLPLEEYRSLVDTRAMGRLSWLIDILRRLQLIRFVSSKYGDDIDKVQKTTLTRALELKPYIEEPVSVSASYSGFVYKDLRPHMRHDFVLLSLKALEEYWGTLEYCYADVESEAALHAFPGSAVPELFRFQAWYTTRVIPADQRAMLLKRVVVNDQCSKIPFKECEEIANDLNLTMGQVLRVYHDKWHHRMKRKVIAASLKRKRNSEQWEENLDSDLHQENLDDQMESPKEQDTNKGENFPDMDHDSLSILKSERGKKFTWTEAADRVLVIEYVRYRAALGPKFNRTDWGSLPNLPAPPGKCIRRMAFLNRNLLFRNAVMRLCNLLSDRYKKHLDTVREYEGSWDDFNDNDVKVALGDVLGCKRLAKLDSSSKKIVDESPEASVRGSFRARRSSLPLQYSKILSKITPLGSKVFDSIAVSTAVELFKLILLSTSTSSKASSMLAETLRRYSQHDLFAAFSFLREKNAMIGGTGSKPFALSQNFLQSVYLSPFPINTGKRTLKFASWLEEKELMEDEIDLPEDLQCGDMFYLCALVSSGELSLVPCLPEDGIGEAETKGLKRKNDSSEICDGGDKSKKMRISTACESEISRREKGFPNIRLLLNRVKIRRSHALDAFKVKNGGESSRFDACKIIETALEKDKTPWDAMSRYANHLFSTGDTSRSFRPELFKSISLAILKSGDQGLSMNEISKVSNFTDEKEVEIIVDVLETFHQTLKVPSFNSFSYVAPLYQTKYSLTPKSVENCGTTSSNPEKIIGDEYRPNSINSKNDDMAHRVTILNHPEEVVVDSETVTVTETHYSESRTASNILPWINGDGTTNQLVYKGLTRRLLGIVTQNPGIMEDNIILTMNALNPQSCRKLLNMMILDNHVIVRQMLQRESSVGPPSIISSLFKSPKEEKSKLIYRDHFFANPMSITLL